MDENTGKRKKTRVNKGGEGIMRTDVLRVTDLVKYYRSLVTWLDLDRDVSLIGQSLSVMLL